ncbi:MAG: aspartate aminotransferase [Nitrospinae bacterium RIFCSPLOWO2_02_FULL_39_110]|nr:MAG: aspartate aminotransferase [Nitrospinae bacterium RIFCSPHIGHO2_02_FULL_39_82]OGW04034.1 MAG: aspartate aminotransferase [Nitrospinae bacterium RIFCSPLOWO2_02_39_17]OGW05048.1 MAG: aspartate aminotransferase [Nitrospinae bacterium RIFCSPLOWO2_02_FULL_39_110]OGW10079.1 MAG: aspartate aminotransferase [Nitrospinae bacterium RIFCSPLOWO2_12_39_15]OGW10317.1 MAG: aspartate aminotransferase [Nitrospinae bacterium RIFCSPLOWO2_12_FULL_39_93]
MRLAERVSRIKPSATLEIVAKAAAMKSEGIDIIGFGAGEPDFDTPENVKKAAIEALKKGYTKYTPVSGINSLKDAIIAKLQRENGLTYNRDEIIVSCGAKHSLYNIAQAMFEEGMEVIIPSPYWVSYPELIHLAGATPVIVNTSEEEDFLLTSEKFERAITKRTKALILNYPSNPTGATYDLERLEEIARIAVKHDIYIISDEVYEKLIYTDLRHISIASLGEEIKELTILVNGLSKTYSMTGWRLGYTAGQKTLITAMNNIQSQSTSNPTSFAQYGGIEALNGKQDDVFKMVEEFKKRRDYIVRRLNMMRGISCFNPSGTFYVFPKISYYYGKNFKGHTIRNSMEMTEYLLKEGHVAVVPGAAFGADNYLRLSFATSMKNIEGGLNMIEDALDRLK